MPIRKSEIGKGTETRDGMVHLEKCKHFCVPKAGRGEGSRLRSREAMRK